MPDSLDGVMVIAFLFCIQRGWVGRGGGVMGKLRLQSNCVYVCVCTDILTLVSTG